MVGLLSGEPAGAQPSTNSAREAHWSDRVSLQGDVRYRIETIDAEAEALRHRHRLRARLSLQAKVLPGLDAVAGLGTGGEDDPVSNNQSLDGAFSSKPLWLDLAYLDYAPEWAPGLHGLAGKMKNPLRGVGKSELLWDSDLNPEGLALRFEPAFGILEPFLRAGHFYVEERGSEEDSTIFGAQAGFRLELIEGSLSLLVGGRYVDHVNIEGADTYYDPEDSFGNRATPDAEGTLHYDHDYDLAGGFAELGGKVGRISWGIFGDYVRNVAIEDRNTGWLVGVALNKCKHALQLCTRYIYRRVEQDAVVGVFTDSDFVGGGTDGEGHEVNLGFQVADAARVATSYFYNHRGLDEEQTYQRVQFDLSAEF